MKRSSSKQFLLRPNAPNLKDAIIESIPDLDESKFLHIAMDGHSTNWNVLEMIDEHLVENRHQKTINIGSCSLHIIHGAFQTGVTKTGRDLNKVLRALFKKLDESLARRDVYLKEGTSGKFALKFCETSWIEDDDVAERALEIWGSVVATVTYWEGLSQSKRPRNNKSYVILVTYQKDLLIPAKLHFFVFIAGILKPYLVVFQTDSPLYPLCMMSCPRF